MLNKRLLNKNKLAISGVSLALAAGGALYITQPQPTTAQDKPTAKVASGTSSGKNHNLAKASLVSGGVSTSQSKSTKPKETKETKKEEMNQTQQETNKDQIEEETTSIINQLKTIQEKAEQEKIEQEKTQKQTQETPKTESENYTTNQTTHTDQPVDWTGSVLTKASGVNQGPSGKETYYNLPMEGVVKIMRGIGNTDEYWVREDGVKMLGDYVMVAADLSIRPRGSLIDTSLGKGIVCDTGSFIYSNPTQLDIAVAW